MINLLNVPEADDPRTLLEKVQVGKYAVKVYWEFDDITLQASGFTMFFHEKPNTPPVIERDSRPAAALLDDPASLQQLNAIGERWRSRVHARMRRDWGEAAFQADENGQWHNPVIGSTGTHFSCLHCEKVFPGADVAAAYWRCPSPDCDGSPLDLRTHDSSN